VVTFQRDKATAQEPSADFYRKGKTRKIKLYIGMQAHMKSGVHNPIAQEQVGMALGQAGEHAQLHALRGQTVEVNTGRTLLSAAGERGILPRAA